MIRRKRLEPMPDRFNILATYNAERSRGIKHTKEWQQRMAELQRHFDSWAKLARGWPSPSDASRTMNVRNPDSSSRPAPGAR